MIFRDRVEAGQLLAKKLQSYKDDDPVVYALPRGGVVLGAEIAKRLAAPLDLVITRKIGHQFNPEYAIGAVTENGELVCNQSEKAAANPTWFNQAVKAEIAEAKRRRHTYLGRGSISPRGKVAILVDDGIATGLTMQAAIKQVKAQGASKIVVAVPVAPANIRHILNAQGAELVSLSLPINYAGSVGAYYDNFNQITDKTVINILKRARLG